MKKNDEDFLHVIARVEETIETVSYTHLDVYKRQDIEYLYTEIVNRLKIKGLIN